MRMRDAAAEKLTCRSWVLVGALKVFVGELHLKMDRQVRGACAKRPVRKMLAGFCCDMASSWVCDLFLAVSE